MDIEQAIDLRNVVASEYWSNNAAHVAVRLQAEILIALTEIRQILENQR